MVAAEGESKRLRDEIYNTLWTIVQLQPDDRQRLLFGFLFINSRVMRVTLVLAGVAVNAACARGSASTVPSQGQLAGTWKGTQALSRITGNDCLVDKFAALIGNSGEFTIVIDQAGRTLTAVIGACRYQGDVMTNLFTLDLDPASCDVTALGLVCPDGSTLRDVRTRSQRLAGAVVGDSATGTSIETIDVLAAGADRVLGALIEEASFAIRKQ